KSGAAITRRLRCCRYHLHFFRPSRVTVKPCVPSGWSRTQKPSWTCAATKKMGKTRKDAAKQLVKSSKSIWHSPVHERSTYYRRGKRNSKARQELCRSS